MYVSARKEIFLEGTSLERLEKFCLKLTFLIRKKKVILSFPEQSTIETKENTPIPSMDLATFSVGEFFFTISFKIM